MRLVNLRRLLEGGSILTTLKKNAACDSHTKTTAPVPDAIINFFQDMKAEIITEID